MFILELGFSPSLSGLFLWVPLLKQAGPKCCHQQPLIYTLFFVALVDFWRLSLPGPT